MRNEQVYIIAVAVIVAAFVIGAIVDSRRRGDLLRTLWWGVGDYTVIPARRCFSSTASVAFQGRFAEPLVQYSQP
jgi:hypothetical protein